MTSASPTKMTIDPTHTELSLHNDPRLLAAVSAIVSHSAQRVGLTAEAQEGLAAAVIDACRETFPLLGDSDESHSALKVIVEDFQDRIEVTIEHAGEALPTAGLDSFCGGGEGIAAGISNSLQDTRVDRVQYEAQNGRSRMKLIKYCGGRKATV
ncbi:MAG: hypothetical protein ACRD5M_13975 [Candidatus Acidiferrales bacterium]